MATKKRGRKRQVIALFKEDEHCTLAGIYLNAYHIEEHLGIHNANIGKYLLGKINTIDGYIAVMVEVGTSPLNVADIENTARVLAKERSVRNKLLKFTCEEVSKLTPEQVLRINQIIDEK